MYMCPGYYRGYFARPRLAGTKSTLCDVSTFRQRERTQHAAGSANAERAPTSTQRIKTQAIPYVYQHCFLSLYLEDDKYPLFNFLKYLWSLPWGK